MYVWINQMFLRFYFSINKQDLTALNLSPFFSFFFYYFESFDQYDHSKSTFWMQFRIRKKLIQHELDHS